MKKLLSSRALRQGGVATLITVLAVVLAVLLNMVVGALSSRFNLSVDLSTGGVFTLSDETKEFVRGVDKPVNITVFTTEDSLSSAGTYYRQAVEMMNGMAALNGNIKVQYVDIVANPGYTAQYPDLNLSSSNILVESEGRTHVLKISDMFNTQIDYNTYSTYITSSKAEQALATAILNVTDENPVKVSILSGHNEIAITDFASVLEMNGYEVIDQNLMTDELDPEAAILIMAAPMRDITEDEAAKLDTFLNNDGKLGKNLVYMASANQPEDTPILNAFLADWGIAVNPGVVYETNQSNLFQLNAFMTLAQYAESDYSAAVKAKNLPFAMPNSRPVEALFESKGYTTVSTLLEFSETSGVMPIDAPEDYFDTDAKADGPHGALLLSERLTYEGTTPLKSHVAVLGSYLAVDPSLIGSANFANSEYLVNLLNKMAGREQSFSVQNKTIEKTELGVTAGQVYGIGLVFTIIIPLAVLIAGIVVWLRRRHR